MKKDEIIRLFCLQFGMIDDDGQVMNTPTIKKELSYEQLYKHFEFLAEYLQADIQQSFHKGELSGIDTARLILRGDSNGKSNTSEQGNSSVETGAQPSNAN